jgi:hypothetical protein
MNMPQPVWITPVETFALRPFYPSINQLQHMNDQDIFDFVTRHLLTQGRRATPFNSNGCLYRAHGGLSCAVGCLIPDGSYHPGMEGRGVRDLTGRLMAMRHPLGQWFAEHMPLLIALMGIHDTIRAAEWRDTLRHLAFTLHLNDRVTYCVTGAENEPHGTPGVHDFNPASPPAWWPAFSTWRYEIVWQAGDEAAMVPAVPLLPLLPSFTPSSKEYSAFRAALLKIDALQEASDVVKEPQAACETAGA